jgi:hypothetical protein
VYAKGGLSNFIEKDEEESIKIANYYTRMPSFNVGADVILPIFHKDSSNFKFVAGLDFGYYSAQSNVPERWYSDPQWNGPIKWEDRFYSLSIPVKLNFKFEKWIYLYGGLVNSFQLNTPKNLKDSKINRYSLSFTGGIDFIIMKRFITGASYYRNITPVMKYSDNCDIYYYVQQITVKVGYIF